MELFSIKIRCTFQLVSTGNSDALEFVDDYFQLSSLSQSDGKPIAAVSILG